MNRSVKVGLFVLFGLVLFGGGIFMIGDGRGFWSSRVDYHAAFLDVAGLKPGAPVRTGGLDIGTVTHVGHGDNVGDPRVYVTLNITKSEAARIRTDTVARVANKGLLGDKMIELTISDAGAPPLEPTVLMKSEEPADMFSAINGLAQQTEKIVARLDPLAEKLGDPQFANDVRGTVADVHHLLDAIVQNDSVAHRLLFDPNEAKTVSTLLANVSQASSQLPGIADDARDVADHIKSGPGIAHAVLYDGDMSANAAGTLSEIHQDLEAIRKGNGLAHAVLYGDDPSQHMMANLNAMSDDLRSIVGNVRAGKGTIGALLVDPSVYEDLKSAIGNVERNEVLRALVRYSIKADEQKPAPEVKAAN
jgi:phospholipid/cholesterol/gamma-HCH transport system substrate-binding protein